MFACPGVISSATGNKSHYSRLIISRRCAAGTLTFTFPLTTMSVLEEKEMTKSDHFYEQIHPYQVSTVTAKGQP